MKTPTQGRADPRDRPLFKELFYCHSCKASSGNRRQKYVDSLSPSRIKSADAGHRPLYYFVPRMICSAELAEDGKLGLGFTLADDLEEIDIGSGGHPRPSYISKKLGGEAKS